jgi:small subunit ribosomal protein S4
MSRYRGPKIRIVRRLGELPGLTTKTTTRDTLPGQHRKARGKQNNASSYSYDYKKNKNYVIITD